MKIPCKSKAVYILKSTYITEGTMGIYSFFILYVLIFSVALVLFSDLILLKELQMPWSIHANVFVLLSAVTLSIAYIMLT